MKFEIRKIEVLPASTNKPAVIPEPEEFVINEEELEKTKAAQSSQENRNIFRIPSPTATSKQAPEAPTLGLLFRYSDLKGVIEDELNLFGRER